MTLEALLKLKQEGKIRAIGVSNVSVEQLKRYGKVASAQERFTLVDRSIMKNGLLDYCVNNSISILSYFSMEQGLLTGVMSPDRLFKEGDTRKTNPLFSPESIRRVNTVVTELRPFAEKYRATVSQIVIALTLAQRGITHMLVGARDAAQAKENAGGGCIELSRDDLVAMNVIGDKLAALHT